MAERRSPWSDDHAGPARTVERYWAALRGEPADLAAATAACFTERARFVSSALPEPLVGHTAIAEHLARIAAATDGAAVEHPTQVQWAHRTARWCWSITRGPDVHDGMDVADFADDDRIELLVVFAGLLPPGSPAV